MKRKCPCGDTFEVCSSNRRKYCNKECRRKYSPPVVRHVVCKVCGEAFDFYGRSRRWYCDKCIPKVRVETVTRSRVKRGLIRAPGVGRGGNQVGNKNGEGRAKAGDPEVKVTNYRRRCLYRWDEKCAICDSTSYIEVHHIDNVPSNYSDDNLIPLCRKCHRGLHSSAKKLEVSVEDLLFVKWPNGRSKIAEKTGTPRGGQPEVKAKASRND